MSVSPKPVKSFSLGSFASAIGKKLEKLNTRIEIGAAGRDQRLLTKDAFRSVSNQHVLVKRSPELLKRLLDVRAVGKHAAVRSHPFFSLSPKEPLATIPDSESADRDSVAQSPSLSDPAVASNPFDGTEFYTISDIISYIAEAVQGSIDKIKPEVINKIRHICFKYGASTTNVPTTELVRLIYEKDVFGPQVDADFVPKRGMAPAFVNHSMFHTLLPARMTWAQLDKLYTEWNLFGKFVVEVDDFFYELQKSVWEERDDKARNEENVRQQIASTQVPVVRFVANIERSPLKDKKYAYFFETESWKVFSSITDENKTMSWDNLYFALRDNLAPLIREETDATILELQQIELENREDEISVVAHSNNIGNLIADEPELDQVDESSNRSYELELEIEKFKLSTESLSAENDSLKSQINDLHAVAQELRNQVETSRLQIQQYVEELRRRDAESSAASAALSTALAERNSQAAQLQVLLSAQREAITLKSQLQAVEQAKAAEVSKLQARLQSLRSSNPVILSGQGVSFRPSASTRVLSKV